MKDATRQSLVRRRKNARPGELIRAAQDVFVVKGFAAARLEDVAARAGVSKGMVYLYFESKETLFKAVIETGLTPAVAVVEALAAETDGSAVERLHRYHAVWQRAMHETSMASLLKLLVAESGNFPGVVQWFEDAVVRPAKRVMTDTIEAGIASGDFRPIAADVAADIFFAPMWLCAFDKVWGSFRSPDQFLGEAFNMLTHGMASALPQTEPDHTDSAAVLAATGEFAVRQP